MIYKKKSLKNVFHEIKKNTITLDNLRYEVINEKHIFIKRNLSNLKILNISNFGNRQFNRLYYISIAKKLANGFIRNGHDVINLSDRDVGKFNKSFRDFKGKSYLNTMIYCWYTSPGIDKYSQAQRDIIYLLNLFVLGLDL